MSSNGEIELVASARRRQPRMLSIVLRLTLWYAFSSFVLIAIATGVLYWALVDTMYREDFRDLADTLNNTRLLLQSSSTIEVPSSREQRPSWAPPQQPQIFLRVLDSNAQTLTETPGMVEHLPTPTKADLAAVIGTPDGEKRDITSAAGKPFLSLIVGVPGRDTRDPPRFIQVAMDREHDENLLARYKHLFWLVLALSLCLSSLLGYFIARSGIRPIENIGQKAARIRATTLHERIETDGLPAELRELAETFNGMLDRLEQSFRYVSQFSDDVAHELRTPINNLRGEIEVALSRSRSCDEYRTVLESCLEECTRISRLIRTLLFLARSDTSAETIQRERVDVGQELRKIETYYEAAATEAGIELNVSAPDGIYAELNRALFQQAIGNLVLNAISHTPAGGLISVVASVDEARLSVGVSDTGCGISPEHLPRVFERFYRVDRARAGSAQNLGLGLAVVKSIAERHGGQIEIRSEVGRGTEVRLLLTAATQ
jgi:two-component system, OmpR family, heavy metal sensor histidine kinase CusS